MNMIIWNTETFMKKLNSFCRDHILTLRNHTLGEEQMQRVGPNDPEPDMVLRLPTDTGLKSSMIEVSKNDDPFSPMGKNKLDRKSSSILVPSVSSPVKRGDEVASARNRSKGEARTFIKLHSLKESAAIEETSFNEDRKQPMTAQIRSKKARNLRQERDNFEGEMPGRISMTLTSNKHITDSSKKMEKDFLAASFPDSGQDKGIIDPSKMKESEKNKGFSPFCFF